MSGYRPCACRDCFEIAIGEEGALCHACQEASCTPCTCADPGLRSSETCDAYNPRTGRHEECQAPGAYGEGGES